jgi:hypothetical protein
MKRGTKTTWKDTWAKIKDTWNTAAGKKNGYTRHKNGTYSVKGKKGLVSKAEGDAAVQNLGKGAAKSLGGMAAGVAVIAAGIAVIAGGIKWGIE